MRKILMVFVVIAAVALVSTAAIAASETFTCIHSGGKVTTDNLDQICPECDCGTKLSECKK